MRPLFRLLAALALAALASPGAAAAQPTTAPCRAADRPLALADAVVSGVAIVQTTADNGTKAAVATIGADTVRCAGRTIAWGADARTVRAYALVPDSGTLVAIGDYTGATPAEALAAAGRAVVRARLADVRAVRLSALLRPRTLEVPAPDAAEPLRATAVHLTGISRTAEPPRVLVDVRRPRVRRYLPAPCPSLACTTAPVQAALDTARDGDAVALTPGAVYAAATGGQQLHLRRRTGGRAGGVVQLVTAGADTLPAGQRVDSLTAARYATVRTTAWNVIPVRADSAASGYWLESVRLDAAGVRNTSARALGRLFDAGADSYTTDAAFAHRLALSHVEVFGHDSLYVTRCLRLEATVVAVLDSRVVGCHTKGADSQAISAISTPGVHAILNNRLDGAGENVMYGGGTPHWGNPRHGAPVPLTVADIEISRNYFYKPLWWKAAKRWTVKNLFELKFGWRVLLDGNRFENSWTDGQSGYAWRWKSSNEWSYPYTSVEDVTARLNHVHGARIFLAVTGIQADSAYPGQQQATARVTVVGNTMDSTGQQAVLNLGRADIGDGPHNYASLLDSADASTNDWAFVGNTFTCAPAGCGASIQWGDKGFFGERLTLRNNVWERGTYTFKGDGQAQSITGLLTERFSTSYLLAGNAFGGAWPASQFSPADRAANRFAPSADSARAIPGVGADTAGVTRATWGVVPCPAPVPPTSALPAPAGAVPVHIAAADADRALLARLLARATRRPPARATRRPAACR